MVTAVSCRNLRIIRGTVATPMVEVLSEKRPFDRGFSPYKVVSTDSSLQHARFFSRACETNVTPVALRRCHIVLCSFQARSIVATSTDLCNASESPKKPTIASTKPHAEIWARRMRLPKVIPELPLLVLREIATWAELQESKFPVQASTQHTTEFRCDRTARRRALLHGMRVCRHHVTTC